MYNNTFFPHTNSTSRDKARNKIAIILMTKFNEQIFLNIFILFCGWCIERRDKSMESFQVNWINRRHLSISEKWLAQRRHSTKPFYVLLSAIEKKASTFMKSEGVSGKVGRQNGNAMKDRHMQTYLNLNKYTFVRDWQTLEYTIERGIKGLAIRKTG